MQVVIPEAIIGNRGEFLTDGETVISAVRYNVSEEVLKSQAVMFGVEVGAVALCTDLERNRYVSRGVLKSLIFPIAVLLCSSRLNARWWCYG